MSEQKSLPRILHDRLVARLVEVLQLKEEQGVDGGALLPLQSHAPMAQGHIGDVRRYTGGPLFQLVTCSIVVPQMQLDSHMLFAFTASDCAVPHFTVDSVRAGDHHAFHLDLIPRVDLGAHLDYLNAVYHPLTEWFERGSAVEGLYKAQLSPRQLAIMSPWMLASRASEAAFREMDVVFDAYMQHWFALLEEGISDDLLLGMGRDALIARDQRNKFAIFNRDIDPVWNRIAPLIGEEAAERQIALLRATSK